MSVLMPAFAAEDFVDEAVRSVESQTLTDWELVAVDDASPDGTLARLEAHANRDSRIRVHRNAKNLGMTGNWNRCLELARGEFVLKLDADDVLRPRAMAVLTAAMVRPESVGAGVRSLLLSPEGEVFGAPPGDAALQEQGIRPYGDVDLSGDRWQEVAAFGHQPWSSSAILVRREWLLASGGWDETYGCAADTDLVLRLLREGGLFCHRGYVGLHYRIVPGSVSDVYRREGWLAWEAVVVYLLNLEKCPVLLARNRRARRHRVALWRLWRNRAGNDGWRQLPERMRNGLEAATRDIARPPLGDLLLDRARRVASRLPL